MGLPGAGKTTFTKRLVVTCPRHIDAYNGNVIREHYDDWDFSDEGRLRQARRMRLMADICIEKLDYDCVCDFVCPTQQLRDIFAPDILVWIDTIKESKYADTNALFEPPVKYDYRILDHIQYDYTILQILNTLLL